MRVQQPLRNVPSDILLIHCSFLHSAACSGTCLTPQNPVPRVRKIERTWPLQRSCPAWGTSVIGKQVSNISCYYAFLPSIITISLRDQCWLSIKLRESSMELSRYMSLYGRKSIAYFWLPQFLSLDFFASVNANTKWRRAKCPDVKYFEGHVIRQHQLK